MKLTDQTTLQVLQLPNDLLWTDELSWSPVVAANSNTLTGALVIEYGTRQAGRPITLQAPDDMAWTQRSTVQTLQNWAALAGRVFTLALEYPTDTRSFSVVFRHDGAPVTAKPVLGVPTHSAGDWFNVALQFTQVIV